MTTQAQKHNLSELVVALRDIKDGKGKSALSPDLLALLDAGLHHSHLPATLQPSAAEAFQLAFEAWGGVPRLLLFADRYPGSFLKLYARQTAPTIAPVVPHTSEPSAVNEWPQWLTARRLAYQEGEGAGTSEAGVAASDDEDA